jgi:hypothetical protein
MAYVGALLAERGTRQFFWPGLATPTVEMIDISNNIRNATNVKENIVVNSFHPVRYAFSCSFSAGVVAALSIEVAGESAII